jgi:hypothetical protein
MVGRIQARREYKKKKKDKSVKVWVRRYGSEGMGQKVWVRRYGSECMGHMGPLNLPYN